MVRRTPLGGFFEPPPWWWSSPYGGRPPPPSFRDRTRPIEPSKSRKWGSKPQNCTCQDFIIKCAICTVNGPFQKQKTWPYGPLFLKIFFPNCKNLSVGVPLPIFWAPKLLHEMVLRPPSDATFWLRRNISSFKCMATICALLRDRTAPNKFLVKILCFLAQNTFFQISYAYPYFR